MNQFHFSFKLLATIIFLLLSSHSKAQASGKEQSPGDKKVTIIAKELPLSDIFKGITKQTGLRFSYNNNDFNQNEKVTAPFIEMPVDKVLRHIFAGRYLSWVYIDNIVRIGKSNKELPASAVKETRPAKVTLDSVSMISITAKVTDNKGNPIPGATILIKGTKKGGSTAEGGNVMLNDVPSSATLVVSSVGYEEKNVRVNGQTALNVVLEQLVTTINAVDVVSTGYQNIPKERATGSFVVLNNKVFNEQVSTGILERLPAIANGINVIPGRFTANQFQITIRGISTVTGPQSPLIVVDNFPFEGNINNINPNDVESITILRDAAATSIWGTRAGNGVIVITTKKGRFNEKVKLEFNTNISSSEEPDLFYLKQIATSDYIDVEKFLFGKGYYDPYLDFDPITYQTPVVDILEREKKGEITAAEAKAQIDRFRGRDIRNEYQKYMYQKGMSQQYALNLRGGSSTVSWLVSAGYDKKINELNSNFDRYNLRVENTYKPIDKLLLTVALTYSNSKTASGASGYNDFPSRVIPPYTAFQDENGNPSPFNTYRQKFIDTIGAGKLLDWNYYPLEDYKHATTNVQQQDILARIGLKYNVLKWLTVDLNYQIEKQNSTTRRLYDAQSFYARDLINRFSNINPATGNVTKVIPNGGILDLAQGELVAQNFRGQLNFDYSFKNSRLNAIVGSEVRDLKNGTNNNRSYGYNPDLLTRIPTDNTKVYPLVHELLGTGTIPFNSNMVNFQNRYISFYSNIAYTFRDKYVITVSGRRDASNLFGVATNDKWTPLWSAGASWDISREAFYNVPILPYLKFRATYGFSGNVSPNASSVTTLAYLSPSIYTNTPRAQVSNFENSELRWEKVGMVNLGVDFEFKNNILTGSVEYFRKNAKDLYGFTTYDRTLGLGVTSIQRNSGELQGDGVDIILNSLNIKRAVTWTTNLNFSYYTDKIKDYYFPDEVAGNYVNGQAVTKGYARYAVFSFKSAGLDPLTGNPQGYLNGKISTNYLAMTIDSAKIKDLNYHGSAIPKYYGSLGNTIGYKNISLTVRVTYQLGHYFLRNSISYTKLFDQGIGHDDFSRRWQKPGDEKITTVPAMNYPLDTYREFFYTYSEPLVTKADHIRLQYINAGYTLTKQNIRWLPFEALKISAMVNNLGIIWRANKYGIDPMYLDPQLPPTKNYTIGIHATL